MAGLGTLLLKRSWQQLVAWRRQIFSFGPSGGQPLAKRAYAEEQVAFTATSQYNVTSQYGRLGGPFVNGVIQQRENRIFALLEPAVKAPLLAKVYSVAALDISVQPEDEDNPQEQEAASFVDWNLRKIMGGSPQMIFDIAFNALVDGFSILEKLFAPVEIGKWKGKWRCSRLKSLDPIDFNFTLDRYRNVDSIRNNAGGQGGQNFLPEDFVWHTHLGVYSNPFGTSDLAAAHRDATMIAVAISLRQTLLANYAGPYVTLKTNDPVIRQNAHQILNDARAFGWIAVGKDDEVQVINLATSSAEQFESTIEDMRKSIATAIGGAFLQHYTNNDGPQGNSETHKSVSELFQWFLSAAVANTITERLVPDLIKFNFPGVPVPSVTLGAVDVGAQLKDAERFEKGKALGLDISKRQARKVLALDLPKDPDDTLSAQPPGGGMMGMGGLPGMPPPGGGAPALPPGPGGDPESPTMPQDGPGAEGAQTPVAGEIGPQAASGSDSGGVPPELLAAMAQAAEQGNWAAVGRLTSLGRHPEELDALMNGVPLPDDEDDPEYGVARFADFDESDHPRAADGKWTAENAGTSADGHSGADYAAGEDALRSWVGGGLGDFKRVTADDVRDGKLPPGIGALYLDTQDQFADQGVESLDLFRGVSLRAAPLLAVLKSRAMDFTRAASWTENERTANDFATIYGGGHYPVVFSAAAMPVSRVLASSRTSAVFEEVERDNDFGAEGEALTAAGPMRLAAVTDRRGNEYDDEEIAEWVEELETSGRIKKWPDLVFHLEPADDGAVARFADWDESQHPRADDGRFGSGQSSGGASDGEWEHVEDWSHEKEATEKRAKFYSRQSGGEYDVVPGKGGKWAIVVKKKPSAAPAVQPEAKSAASAPPPPEKKKATGERWNEATTLVADAITGNRNLSPEQKHEYTAAAREATKRMPPAAVEAIRKNVRGFSFHSNLEHLRYTLIEDVLEKSRSDDPKWIRWVDEHVLEGKVGKLNDAKRREQLEKRFGNAAGVYSSEAGRVYLDGGAPGMPAHEVYAHELTHAIDHNRVHSDTAAWKAVQDEEIDRDGDPLTAYARTAPVEGFAEFGRAVYTGDTARRNTIARKFPKATAYFKENGLWPSQDLARFSDNASNSPTGRTSIVSPDSPTNPNGMTTRTWGSDYASFADEPKERSEGEVWQGKGNRWYTRKGGRTVPTHAPGYQAPTGPKGPNPADVQRAAGSAREPARKTAREAWQAATEGRATPDQLPALAAHLQTLTRDELREISRGLEKRVGGLKAEVVNRLLLHVGVDPADAAVHLDTHAPREAAWQAFEAAGGAKGAPMSVADAYRAAHQEHAKAMRKAAGGVGPLSQPPAVHGKPELTGNDARQVNWARGERKKVLDRHAGKETEQAARDHFEGITSAAAVLDGKDGGHEAAIRRRHAAGQARPGAERPPTAAEVFDRIRAAGPKTQAEYDAVVAERKRLTDEGRELTAATKADVLAYVRANPDATRDDIEAAVGKRETPLPSTGNPFDPPSINHVHEAIEELRRDGVLKGNGAGGIAPPRYHAQPAITPEEHERRLAELDPRDSGQVEVSPKPRPAHEYDDPAEQEAALDMLRRAEEWQADRPESVAAEEYVRRAQARVERAGAGEGEPPHTGGTASTRPKEAAKPPVAADRSGQDVREGYARDLDLDVAASESGHRNADAYLNREMGLGRMLADAGHDPGGDALTTRATSEAANALHDYRSRGNRAVAKKLRAGEPLSPDEQRQFAAVNGLASRMAVPQAMQLHRVAGRDVLGHLKPGDTFADPAPMFTGVREDDVRNIRAATDQMHMRILADKGAPGVHVSGGEGAEVILPGGHPLEVVSNDGKEVVLRHRPAAQSVDRMLTGGTESRKVPGTPPAPAGEAVVAPTDTPKKPKATPAEQDAAVVEVNRLYHSGGPAMKAVPDDVFDAALDKLNGLPKAKLAALAKSVNVTVPSNWSAERIAKEVRERVAGRRGTAIRDSLATKGPEPAGGARATAMDLRQGVTDAINRGIAAQKEPHDGSGLDRAKHPHLSAERFAELDAARKGAATKADAHKAGMDAWYEDARAKEDAARKPKAPAAPAPSTGSPGADAAWEEYRKASPGSKAHKALGVALSNLHDTDDDGAPVHGPLPAGDRGRVLERLASVQAELVKGGASADDLAPVERAIVAAGGDPAKVSSRWQSQAAVERSVAEGEDYATLAPPPGTGDRPAAPKAGASDHEATAAEVKRLYDGGGDAMVAVPKDQFVAALDKVDSMPKAKLKALAESLNMAVDGKWNAADIAKRIKQRVSEMRWIAVRNHPDMLGHI